MPAVTVCGSDLSGQWLVAGATFHLGRYSG